MSFGRREFVLVVTNLKLTAECSSRNIRSGSVFVTASCGHYGQRAARIGPDSIFRTRLPAPVSAPFFQRRHGRHCAKLTQVPSGGPGQGLAKHIWSGGKLVCRNHLAQFLAGRNLLLPVCRFQTRFRSSTDVPDNTVQNQPGSDSVLADCVRFWPNGPGPEASKCAKIIRSASGQCFPADPDRIRIGSDMLTGMTLDVVLWINLPSHRSSHTTV